MTRDYLYITKPSITANTPDAISTPARIIITENAALNGVDRDRYTVRAGDVTADRELQREFGGDYDVVVANIVADVIIALAPRVRPLLKAGGVFLCSGIIDDRAAEVKQKLLDALWQIEEERSSEGWFSYTCR